MMWIRNNIASADGSVVYIEGIRHEASEVRKGASGLVGHLDGLGTREVGPRDGDGSEHGDVRGAENQIK